jgi:cytochrome c oxidase cbb3-type subunit 2
MTSLRKFVFGIGLAFVLPWLILLVIPHAKMRAAAVETWEDKELSKMVSYPPGTPNSFRRGHAVYGEEGCASCHTQMIKPTFMSFESYRPDFGKEGTIEAPVAVRSTVPGDYRGEEFAYLGVQRIGSDLSNVGYRHDEAWHHLHLYNPRALRKFSTMPSFRHLYEKRKIRGQRSADALPLTGEFDPGEGIEVVPTERAKALVEYLLTLKKDAPLPPDGDDAPAGGGGDVK